MMVGEIRGGLYGRRQSCETRRVKNRHANLAERLHKSLDRAVLCQATESVNIKWRDGLQQFGILFDCV